MSFADSGSLAGANGRPQLIYFHIEKSAGSSQRRLFYDNYGKDDVYWMGLEQGPRKPTDLKKGYQDRRILGGHFGYHTFARDERTLLFSAVIRDPVERAISLFNYCATTAPERIRKNWLSRGLKPTSMLDTINGSRSFVGQVRDLQCKQICGAARFEQAHELIHSKNFIVGCFDRLPQYNLCLGSLLNWSVQAMGRHNAGPDGYRDAILAEPGLVEAVRDLNQEDQKLYALVRHAGVFEHLPDRDVLETALAVDKP